MNEFRDRRNPVERYGWMAWLYTVVGCFIVALLVLMFLDMSNRSGELEQDVIKNAPGAQISGPAISNFNSPTIE